MLGTAFHRILTESGPVGSTLTSLGGSGGPSSWNVAWAGCGRVSAQATPPPTASRTKAKSITAPAVRIGFWLKAPSTVGRSGVPPYGEAGPCCTGASARSPVTVKGIRVVVPRSFGVLVRTQTIARASPPRASSTTSGRTRKPRASSWLEAVSLSLAGELPQLLSWTTWRPRQRPEELTGRSLAWRPNTLPISRSPSTTALASASSVDRTRMPNGQVPPGAPVPPGGLNTITALASCCG